MTSQPQALPPSEAANRPGETGGDAIFGNPGTLRFLLAAGEALASSLDYRTTLTTLSNLAVPAIADWCAVDLLDETGTLQRLSVAHRDPTRIRFVEEIQARYPENREAPTGSYARLRGNRTEWVSDIPDEMLVASARDPEHLDLIRSLGLRSFISVPLRLDGVAIGLFTVVTAESARRYSSEDVQVVEELARRASIAIGHARAHALAVEHAEQLEQQALEMELQAEELREAEHLSSGIVESIADPMVVYSADWRVRYENAAAVRVFAAGGKASMLGRVVWEEYPALVGTAFEREMKRAMDTRTATGFVEALRGESVWTEVRCYPLPDGGVTAVWRDITMQKRAERMLDYLARASDVLGSSLDYDKTINALARLVVPELADWCSISVLEGDVIRLVGVAHADPAKVALVCELDARHPIDPNGATRTATVIRTGRSEHVERISDDVIDATVADAEYRALLRQLGFASSITVPLKGMGRVLGAMSMVATGNERRFTDDSVRIAEEVARRAAVAVENALLYQDSVAAKAAAESANDAKTEFLARMSHELRTPLNAIAGYADLMAMGIRGPVTDDQLSDLERIRRSQRHLLSLINDILNYAKVEAGKLEYDIRPAPLNVVLESIESLFAPQLAERGLSYGLVMPSAPVNVLADADKLQQILVNLVSNAVKFTPAGGSIRVGATITESVRITVADTGMGIPLEKQETIFEPFVQLRTGGQLREGTGLGLAISRDLARAMNGDLTVESGPGGSTFTLTLPRA